VRLLEEDVRGRPAATVSDRHHLLAHITGRPLSDLTARRLMKRIGFSRKNDHRDDGTGRVLESRLEGDGRKGLEANRLVFVDEMSTNSLLAPLYAWSHRGERARCSVPRNRRPNTTLLASMNSEGMGPCLTVVGTTTAAVFEAYVERVLAPTLCAGEVMAVDNLSAHKGERVKEMIEERRVELLLAISTCRPTRRISSLSKRPA
jgi:DDE superfamily endonuclease